MEAEAAACCRRLALTDCAVLAEIELALYVFEAREVRAATDGEAAACLLDTALVAVVTLGEAASLTSLATLEEAPAEREIAGWVLRNALIACAVPTDAQTAALVLPALRRADATEGEVAGCALFARSASVKADALVAAWERRDAFCAACVGTDTAEVACVLPTALCEVRVTTDVPCALDDRLASLVADAAEAEVPVLVARASCLSLAALVLVAACLLLAVCRSLAALALVAEWVASTARVAEEAGVDTATALLTSDERREEVPVETATAIWPRLTDWSLVATDGEVAEFERCTVCGPVGSATSSMMRSPLPSSVTTPLEAARSSTRSPFTSSVAHGARARSITTSPFASS